ncbi:Oidioi.mRNA.OKI2018_I69.chr2.g5819.t1.cds [Oikopleura dioica]|uniref:Oidioi.mRNA.OKI2018_I69.chr2.g5819.t1.cds n=1 Tax=Oikopleura dioica TaxID=34765 RepID=A0ABN7T5S8_OIKDI|nr:Oidioi.mRNA.OKI2018_I69.chr2.g5819.t1.cds [Oikopleura dioica]
MNHEIQTMKLAVTLLSCSVVLAKVPHKVDDLEEMDEDERKQFDDDIFTFNEDGEEWDAWEELSEDQMKNRLTKIFDRIDSNKDGNLDRDEVVDHTYKALFNMDEQEAEAEFVEADVDANYQVTWSEFVEEFYGLSPDDEANILAMDTDTGVEFNHMYSRDQARFQAADNDRDGKLTLVEYKRFKNPLQSKDLLDLAIEWALRSADKNKDKKISFEEYMSDFREDPGSNLEHYGEEFTDQEEQRFQEDLDLDGDGFIAGDELKYWLGPDNIAIAIEESDHIFDSVDSDEDNLITIHEMLEGFQTFIDSDVTEFGGQLRHIKDEL